MMDSVLYNRVHYMTTKHSLILNSVHVDSLVLLKIEEQGVGLKVCGNKCNIPSGCKSKLSEQMSSLLSIPSILCRRKQLPKRSSLSELQ